MNEFVAKNLVKREAEKCEQIYWLSKLAAVKRHMILYSLLNKNWENAYEHRDCETCFAYAFCCVQKDANEFKEPKHIQDCVDKIIEMSIINFLADPQCSEEQVLEVALNDVNKFKAIYEDYENWRGLKNGISTG